MSDTIHQEIVVIYYKRHLFVPDNYSHAGIWADVESLHRILIDVCILEENTQTHLISILSPVSM
jgi:hypothetical protein